MEIGTPLTPGATRVMLLGSGELGKEVVIELQRLGIEVIAVDRYSNAPAQQLAHRAHTIDMTDAQALRTLIDAERPHLIVPEIEAIATETLLTVEQEGLAGIIPNAEAVATTMNRERIRRLAAEELELPTSRYAFAGTCNELKMAVDGVIGYPCIVKPVMSSSGKGQSTVESPEELSLAWERAQTGGRVATGRVIVEEKIDFDYEITLLTVRAAGPDSTTTTHFCQPIGHRQVDGDYVESWQPHPMNPKVLARSQEIATAVTGRLGGWGIFGVELFIRGDQVWFSEVSPRPHDTGLVTLCTQRQSEFALHARAILGLPVDVTLHHPGASAVIYGNLEAHGISYRGIDTALEIPGSELRLFGKPRSYPRRRMGVALAQGESIHDAREKARQVAQAVQPTR